MMWFRLSVLVALNIQLVIGRYGVSRDDANLELVHVNMLFRHGARSPTRAFPSDPNRNYQWNQNGGAQLTTRGMRQAYALGRFFRNRYNGFLSSDYNREEIYIRSTDRDRTIMSAQCALAGLYPPKGDQIWTSNPPIMWQPIPVHTIPTEEDTLLYFPELKGPRHVQLLGQVLRGSKFQYISRLYRNFIQELQRLTRIEGDFTIMNIYDVYDPLVAASAEGLRLPRWYNRQRRQSISTLTTFFFGNIVGYGTPYQDDIIRLFAGRLLQQLLQNFEDVINGNNTYKAIAYSAHDFTIVQLLVAFDNFDDLPPFSASLMFELYKDTTTSDDRQYILRTFYRTSPNKLPTQLNLLGCGLDCPLGELRRKLAHLLPSAETNK